MNQRNFYESKEFLLSLEKKLSELNFISNNKLPMNTFFYRAKTKETHAIMHCLLGSKLIPGFSHLLFVVLLVHAHCRHACIYILFYPTHDFQSFLFWCCMHGLIGTWIVLFQTLFNYQAYLKTLNESRFKLSLFKLYFIKDKTWNRFVWTWA